MRSVNIAMTLGTAMAYTRIILTSTDGGVLFCTVEMVTGLIAGTSTNNCFKKIKISKIFY